MNTSALVSRMNSNTLPQWSPAAPGYIAMHAGSEADQSRAASRLMGAIRRFWWIVAMIWAIIAIPASIYIYKTIPPQYLAINYITVAPVVQNPVNGDSRPNPFYTEYLHTQAELMKDPHVLRDAAADIRLRQYPWFQKLPDQVGYLTDHVEVAPIGSTQNISISMTHQDAGFATAVVDSIIDAYFRHREDIDNKSLASSLSIVQDLQATTAKSLRDAQDKLARLTSDGDMVWSNQDQKVLVDVISSAKQTLGKLDSEELSIESQLAELKNRKLPDESIYTAGVAIDGDPQIQQWTTERNRVLMADNVLASKHATIDHPDRVEFRKQLKTLDGKIANRKTELQNNSWAAYKSKFELERVNKINDLNATLTGLQQQIAALTRHVDRQETLAKDLGTKEQPILALKEQISDSKDALKRYNDRIEEIQNLNRAPGRVTPGGPTVEPKTPKVDKRPKLAFAANGIGILIGMGVLVLLMKLRDKIEGADDLRQHYQPLIVGTVSHAGSAARGLNGRMSRKILGEEMRLLHANLLPPGPTQRRIMMVTSPTPSNGKTSIASQLALSLAKSGMEVLLIDADLRKRDISTMFDVGFRPGLSDLLQSKTPELIRPVELLPNLRLMGAGSKLDRNPVELFQRRHFHESLNLLQDRFDCVVVDTPPTLVVADARLIARSCDDVLVVVRAQVSSQKDVDQTVDALQRVTGKAPKIILNGVAHRQSYYKYKFAYTSENDYQVEAGTAAETTSTNAG
ncbi:MAG TPA: polysaccharide biosynthesis tyrosine autokinase [Phycisphaerae bacterium]|nr:polysaccharide biosynthesis tyrosine autokinase [Phycisphaerae bacterium]